MDALCSLGTVFQTQVLKNYFTEWKKLWLTCEDSDQATLTEFQFCHFLAKPEQLQIGYLTTFYVLIMKRWRQSPLESNIVKDWDLEGSSMLDT